MTVVTPGCWMIQRSAVWAAEAPAGASAAQPLDLFSDRSGKFSG